MNYCTGLSLKFYKLAHEFEDYDDDYLYEEDFPKEKSIFKSKCKITLPDIKDFLSKIREKDLAEVQECLDFLGLKFDSSLQELERKNVNLLFDETYSLKEREFVIQPKVQLVRSFFHARDYWINQNTIHNC